MNKDMIWNIVLLVSLLLLAHGLLSMGDTDKKTAQAAENTVIIGGIGVGAFVVKKTMAAAVPVAAGIFGVSWLTGGTLWAIIGAIASVPFLLGQFKDMFTGGPSIPTWVWVVGALLLFLMIARMGRR